MSNHDPGRLERVARAISHVESRHDPCAVSPSGTFIGQYQMGPAAALDVGLQNVKMLRCNAELARWAFDAYIRRYRRWHDYRPDLVAITWKGGPGTARLVRERVDAGRSVDSALDELAELDKLPDRTREYLALFRAAYVDPDTVAVASSPAGAYVL